MLLLNAGLLAIGCVHLMRFVLFARALVGVLHQREVQIKLPVKNTVVILPEQESCTYSLGVAILLS
jgi:hypothetical protein